MSIVLFTPGQVFLSVICGLCPSDVARLDSALCVHGNRALFLQQLRLPFISLRYDKMEPSSLFYKWVVARSIKLSCIYANESLVKHGMDVLRISGSALRVLTIDHNSGLSRRSASAILFAVAINCRELLTFSNSVKVHTSALGLLFSQCGKIQNVKMENRFTTTHISTITIFLKDVRKIELTSDAADLGALMLLTDGCPHLHTLSCPHLFVHR